MRGAGSLPGGAVLWVVGVSSILGLPVAPARVTRLIHSFSPVTDEEPPGVRAELSTMGFEPTSVYLGQGTRPVTALRGLDGKGTAQGLAHGRESKKRAFSVIDHWLIQSANQTLHAGNTGRAGQGL